MRLGCFMSQVHAVAAALDDGVVSVEHAVAKRLAAQERLEAVIDLRRGVAQVMGMEPSRKSYPSDVSDDDRALVAPYLTLLREDAEQHEYSLREVFNGLRYVIKTGALWRWMPNDLPPSRSDPPEVCQRS